MAKDKIKYSIEMTADDMEKIHQRKDQLGIIHTSAYIRKMALNGYCVNLNLPEIREMVRLLRICSNNLNEYAKRADETGSIYTEDIRDLQIRMDEIWETAKGILASLAKIS